MVCERRQQVATVDVDENKISNQSENDALDNQSEIFLFNKNSINKKKLKLSWIAIKASWIKIQSVSSIDFAYAVLSANNLSTFYFLKKLQTFSPHPSKNTLL